MWALSLVCYIYRQSCDTMAIENERKKNGDLDLGSVRYNDRDKSDIVKREEARLALKT